MTQLSDSNILQATAHQCACGRRHNAVQTLGPEFRTLRPEAFDLVESTSAEDVRAHACLHERFWAVLACPRTVISALTRTRSLCVSRSCLPQAPATAWPTRRFAVRLPSSAVLGESATQHVGHEAKAADAEGHRRQLPEGALLLDIDAVRRN